MRIGIFGGCFNPPHIMHKKIGLQLIEKNILDKVIYVPTGNRYQKNDLVDAKDRFDMLNIMTKNIYFLEVSDYEIKNTLTYTYQTLDYFKTQYPNDEIYFICGSDNLKEFTTWKNYEYILNHFKILVIQRNHDDISEILYNMNNQNIEIANIEEKNISSTDIRKMLKNNWLKTEEILDQNVIQYIKQNKLYK